MGEVTDPNGYDPYSFEVRADPYPHYEELRKKIAEVEKGFSGRPLGAIGGALLGGRGGAAMGAGVGSVSTSQVAGVWIVGMRYKIIDA